MNVCATRELLQSLGFRINLDECHLLLATEQKFLGFIINSQLMSISLTAEKRTKILNLAVSFKNRNSCRIRELAQFIGILIPACPAVEYGFLYTKILERQKFLALDKFYSNYEAKMTLAPLLAADLNWWINNINSTSSTIRDDYYEMEIYSDASRSDWGAAWEKKKTRGWWNSVEQNYQINFLELKAAFYGLKCFAKDLKSCQILLRIDNTTAISYINKMSSIQFPNLSILSREIWQWCEKKNIWIFASHISSSRNFIADKESRISSEETEWELADYAFRKVNLIFGKFDVDLFATLNNTKCSTFFSWFPDPSAAAVDAFTVSWSRFFFYAFPPFSLIMRTSRKITRDKAEGVLVVPHWPSEAWFPLFKSLSISEPTIFSNMALTFPGSDQIIRKAFLLQDVPRSAPDTTMASLSQATLKQYERPVSLWWKFCQHTQVSVFSPPRRSVLEFLTICATNLGSYSSLNTYRSAISLITMTNVGQDQFVKRFMKGFATQKPPRPKYNETWDPSKVLDHISQFYPNSELSFEKLSEKLVVLLALITAQRVQTLSLKESRTFGLNRNQPRLIIPAFKEKLQLCPVQTLRDYLDKSKALSSPRDPFLIVITKAPYTHASSQTISHWIKKVLNDSGIDRTLAAHSTRHASTSAAARQALVPQGREGAKKSG
ncbi:uncharacterized protein LOC124405884 [Diprion similis]|uniref:uncharacterized protein LOC124405884 n=1 Tax=Diprion similis TaxID=362088 RepID=UPI001EF97596|nr:uncharacterized protein LOC124405884 [Diprion similis]